MAQVIKIIVELVRYRKTDFRRLLGSGGMPSSHSSTVVTLATATGKACGTASAEFAIAAIFAIVVMYDAANVRRAAGEQAKILNYIMRNWENITPEMLGRELKELLGHTPIQVFAGAALGFVIGILA